MVVLNTRFEFEESPCDARNVCIPTTLQEGNVVLIPRTEGRTTKMIPVYIRQHLVDKVQELSEQFETTKLLHAYVTGTSGCGTTCFFWMWAFRKVQDHKRVLFIHQDFDTPIFWILENNRLKRMISPELEKNNLKWVVDCLLRQETGKFDFAILDGVRTTEEKSKAIMNKIMSKTGNRKTDKISKAIFVTSFDFDFPYGALHREDIFEEDVDVGFDSWTESDYDRAFQSSLMQQPAIRQRLLLDWNSLTKNAASNAVAVIGNDDDERLKQVVKLKYPYAGGCARFMFGYNFVRLKLHLDQLLARCKEAEWTQLTSNAIESGGTNAVNRLMQRFMVKGGLFCCTPFSEYVLFRTYQVCGSKLTKAVEAAAAKTKNPLLLGWAFELAELDKIDRARNLNLFPHAIQWSAIQIDIITPKQDAQHEIAFCPQSMVVYNEKEIQGHDSIVSGTVIWCDIWNQSGFDVAVYIGTTLVTIQVTGRKSHTLSAHALLKDVSNLRSALMSKDAIVN